MTGGAGSTWTKGSTTGVTVSVKRSEDDVNCIDYFSGVEIDGSPLASGDYEVKSGSTVVTIKAAALQKLKDGKHTITVKFKDGSVSTDITVKAASGSPDKPTTPKTGDDNNLVLWMSPLALSLVGLVGVASFGRKRRAPGRHSR